MIRFNPFPLSGLPVSAPAAPPRQAAGDGASWFRADTEAARPRISGDFDPMRRGLTVSQHASRVLDCLCDSGDDRR